MDAALTRKEDVNGTNPVEGDAMLDEDGNLASLESDSQESARQNLEVALKTVLGEWFVDPSKGVDWFAVAGEKGARSAIESRIEGMVRAEVAEQGTVATIYRLKATLDTATRIASVTIDAQLKSGEDISLTVSPAA